MRLPEAGSELFTFVSSRGEEVLFLFGSADGEVDIFCRSADGEVDIFCRSAAAELLRLPEAGRLFARTGEFCFSFPKLRS